MGPNPNDGHARGGGMDWLSKIFGTENFWMAILLVLIKIDLVQEWSKHRTMGIRVAAVWIDY